MPDSYAAQPERRYPILYVTDGYWDYKLLKSIVGGLVYDKAIPEIILVGIGYPGEAPDYGRLRRWDLTPVSDSPRTTRLSARADTRRTFWLCWKARSSRSSKDATARIRRFACSAARRWAGCSRSTSCSRKPALFAAYIAPSPAVPYAAGWLLGREEAFAKSGKPLAARLYMTAAEKEQPWFLHAVKKLDARLRARAYPGLKYEFRIIDGEGHSGTKPESFNRGVRFAFAPLAPTGAER